MITKDDVNQVRAKAATVKALVIGDAMLDKYIYGYVDRISPEAPVPILKHSVTEKKAGGAANVAINLASWGCVTSIAGMIGNDAAGKELTAIMQQKNISHHFFVSDNRPTTVKTRVVAASHHLLRIDEESVDYLSEDEESEVIQFIDNTINSVQPDLIIIEDYNKGFLTKKIISLVLAFGAGQDIYVAVDPKEKNFMNYIGADLFKPNLREAIEAAHKNLNIEDLKDLSAEWHKAMNLGTIAITLGAQGIFLSDGQGAEEVKPARSIDVVDVCGAGDAVICALALARLAGLDLKKSGALANLTGAYVCSHSGVVSVDPEEIEGWL